MTRPTTNTRRRSVATTDPGAHAGRAPQSRTTGQAERVAALQEQILTTTQQLVEAGAWRRMLATAARFHTYSTGTTGMFQPSQ